jgi:hypothetical protein
MNSKTYLKNLAREWGGMKQERLIEKLTRLVDLAKSEVDIHKPILLPEAKPEPIKSNDESMTRYLKETIEKSIADINKSNTSNYDKALLLKKVFGNYPEWHHITMIPIDYFNEFWNLCEKKNSGIIFDNERDLQYFKVIR